jgi:predicted transcriptional regulator
MTHAMKIPTTLTLEPDVRAALERAAACQDRTRSWVANRVLREQLIEPPPAPVEFQQQEHPK